MNKTKKPKVKKTSRELVPVEPEMPSQILPAIPGRDWIEKYNQFLSDYDQFIDKQMKSEIDYGIIPGTQKPTLYLAGAQKLEKLFFLTSKTNLVEKVIKDDYSFIKYSYRTSAYRGQTLVATCEGTCNSKEKKYRWETVFDNQATDEQKKAGKLLTRTSRGGKSYSVYIIEKREFYDIENTIMKMAQKRAYVGAILIATNSSGRFTQDIEDMAVEAPQASNEVKQPATAVGQYGEPVEPFPAKKRTTLPKLVCSECGLPISQAEKKYSEDRYGFALGRCCQSKFRQKT